MAMPYGLEKAVAENPGWLLARRLRYRRQEYISGDSILELQLLGFKILESDGSFYCVQPPKGWNMSTEQFRVADKEGNTTSLEITTLFDDRKNERAYQFHYPENWRAYLHIARPQEAIRISENVFQLEFEFANLI